MKKPLIGITMHADRDPIRAELDTLVEGIVTGLERAGGLPVLIPHGLSDETARAVFERLDGILFTGGGDVEPALYHAAREAETAGVDADRDRVEMALARWAADEGTPFFGICRGSQVVNVALGGTLYQEVSRAPNAMKHTYGGSDYPDSYLAHPVQVAEDSHLARLLGKPVLSVNSMHHQMVARPSPRVRPTALSPDGHVEAIEVADHPFGVAVQWHPEALLHIPEMQALFDGLVDACRR
ncbi:MAG: gamma-glutamyl-gamma-aminobutyrate hydrolase family protein [Thermoflexales bacterium]|nr:gamma-glutamyl-gamma-aminobutyrate hydrolase family protein [Thermoflexales bacterium]